MKLTPGCTCTPARGPRRRPRQERRRSAAATAAAEPRLFRRCIEPRPSRPGPNQRSHILESEAPRAQLKQEVHNFKSFFSRWIRTLEFKIKRLLLFYQRRWASNVWYQLNFRRRLSDTIWSDTGYWDNEVPGPRGGSGLIFLGSGQARAFSGLKNLLNKSSLIRARALLHKWKSRALGLIY